MLSAGRRAAGSANAAVYRPIARHHHSDIDPILSRPLCPRRGGYGDPEGLVAAGGDRRDRRQRDRALRAGAAVQDRVRRGGMVRRGAPFAGARDLEVRRRPSAGAVDEDLRLLRRASLHADGHWRRVVLQPAYYILLPAASSIALAFLCPRCASLPS